MLSQNVYCVKNSTEKLAHATAKVVFKFTRLGIRPWFSESNARQQNKLRRAKTKESIDDFPKIIRKM